MDKNENKIEFVSYSGEYPTLCHGVLTVKIDGKEYKFGHEPLSYDMKKHCYADDNLPTFWESGGECGFGINEDGETDYGDEIVGCGEWQMTCYESYEFPEKIKSLLPEILKCMNEHAPHGCCGGCI